MSWASGESRTTEGKGGPGSAGYTMLRKGGVFSCSCPAWRFQKVPIEQRTCKHLKRERGVEVEEFRIQGARGRTRPVPKTEKSQRNAKVVIDSDGREYEF